MSEKFFILKTSYNTGIVLPLDTPKEIIVSLQLATTVRYNSEQSIWLENNSAQGAENPIIAVDSSFMHENIIPSHPINDLLSYWKSNHGNDPESNSDAGLEEPKELEEVN